MHVSPILANKLLIGSCPVNEADIEQLKAAGVSAVLSLQTDEDFEQRDIDWRAMEAGYRRLGMEVRRWPITDFSPRDMRRKLRPCVRLLNGLLRAGTSSTCIATRASTVRRPWRWPICIGSRNGTSTRRTGM